MPGAFVVDASVVVEFLAPGHLGASADRFMGGLAWHEPLELVAPDLLFLEAANALRKLAARRAIRERAADRAVSRLAQLPIAGVPGSALIEDAWAHRGALSVYDGAYVALARGLALPLVTADGRLARAARGHRARAWRLGDPDLDALLMSLSSGERQNT